MPISGDQYTDQNQQRYSLPMDSCVGMGGGPTPEQVANISGPAKIPYADSKTLGSVPTIVSGPDLPNDHDTDDADRY